jgi:lipopolysaccharide export system protein LptA
MRKPPAAFAVALALALPCMPMMAETFVFSADRVTSSMAEGKERTILQGRAKVKSGTLSIQADKIELSGKDFSILECSGSVVAVDDEEGLSITPSHLVYDRKRKFSHMDGATVIEDLKNRVVLKARWVENDGKSRVMVAEVNVRILKEGLSCRAEYAIYRRDEKILELTGAPTAYKDGDEYRATRIVINTDTEEVRLEGAVQGTLTSKSGTDSSGGNGAPAPGTTPPDGTGTGPATGGGNE